MKKIAFFQHDLEIGGIQKGLINLLNNLDPSKFQTELTLFSKGGQWENRIPDYVTVHYLEPFPAKSKYMPFDLALSRYGYSFEPMEREFDAAIDYNSYQPWTAAAAITVPAAKRVMMVHNDMEIKYREEWKYRVLFHFMKGKYKYFDAFAFVSDPLKEPFARLTGEGDKEFITLPNFIDTKEILRKKTEDAGNFCPPENTVNLCAVGRLCHQKGYDIMLDLFSRACQDRNDLHLYILGDGPEKESIQRKIRELALEDSVSLLGWKDNPFPVMDRCDALLSTSRYEGQGINLYEAKALGLQVLIPDELQKYAPEIEGSDDLVNALRIITKKEKNPDSLQEYNQKILAMLERL